jgi:hypothetical protein
LKGHKIAKVQKELRITPKVVSAVFSKVKKKYSDFTGILWYK